MVCKYLRKRQYNLKPYFYCSKKKKEIKLNNCFNCKKYETRSYKPIKKISKKIAVTPQTYNEVIERDNYSCRLNEVSQCEGKLELHHIVYRSEDKSLINEPSNCIMLCTKHHGLVHSNKDYWQDKLKELIK